ncbi:Pyruvate:ferredoxin oxidoreductase, beta subunit [Desulfocicer vacuolatum DSM 3385]|uniref:Pyruvate:ferredoxin oxidoreductase, beta subunit n=1 Tax=Desulfocicer vacuolatum DSM 3385 TaxID=1121400 RepID=A0A1W2DP92_9BACT|nr:thiamine pyrophosphate-dependent enzyme [Desulfocicer vacuolatum]SMC98848.1 Pyruvate:ferredoxin oxidoreductase, beta subunit [Desulfocicer vacuolatum DSM 3385]
MSSLLNTSRPPVFCPGCTHERITKELDKALVKMGIPAEKTVIVTDIGCSGLFDTFFNVHALHGLHGRALTYASGLKLADPELNVIVTMGDGGLGIGGAHVLSSCRKNMDITLIILNNFNFGMTGGQYSATTPSDAVVGSEFLNNAEVPIDICEVAKSAGATWIGRYSGHDAALSDHFVTAMQHKGFSMVETLGMCTGRYTKRNKLNLAAIDAMIEEMPSMDGVVEKNQRPEYGERYRAIAAEKTVYPEAVTVEQKVTLDNPKREDIVILGSAGMRIVTAGDIVCFAGMVAGLNASMKNDYNITVLRGQSVSELILTPEEIGYAGLEIPSIVLALSDEGVQRRKKIFPKLTPETLVVKEASVTIPETAAEVVTVDYKAMKIKRHDWALASLGFLAKRGRGITEEMLIPALKARFNEKVFGMAMETVEKTLKG